MKKRFLMIPAALALTLALAPAAYAEDYEKANEYLGEYYNVEIEDDVASVEQLNEILAAMDQEAVEGEELSEGDIVVAGVKLAGLDELAQTYENEAAADKEQKVLDEIKEFIGEETAAEITEEQAPYFACAFDLGLLGEERDQNAVQYLMKCAEIGGKARNYIGRASDPDILTRLEGVLKSLVIFDEPELSELGSNIVLQGITTGYNLKYSGYDAHFLEDYTLRYGHDDARHAIQLVGLMRSEGMDGYLQIEPKVSVYEYMIDWGDPGDPTPTYAVKEVAEGRYLCYAVEYDLAIEFDSLEDKERFHEMIETYAKKYDDRVDEDGNVTAKLIASSWWQPLYYSRTPMENEEFGELNDNVIYDETGAYAIHSFGLPEKTAEVETAVKGLAPELEVNAAPLYVNPAFMRYTTGEDHQ